MSCTCQDCGVGYKVDLLIPDALWEAIRGDKNLLCGVCIMDKIEDLDEYGSLKVTEGQVGK